MPPLKHLVWSFAFIVLTPLATGQTFDEQFETWPTDLTIRGTILAGGGGDLPMLADTVFLRGAGRDDTDLVLIHFGELDKATRDNWKERWKEHEIQSLLSAPEENDSFGPEIMEALKTATGIWLASDSPLSAHQIKALGASVPALKAALKRRAIVVCESEVTPVLSKQTVLGGISDEFPGHARVGRGVNLIPDTVIMTDYQKPHSAERLRSVLGSHPRSVGVGIEKGTAIVLSGRKIRVMGSGKATFMLMANHRSPIRHKVVEEIAGRRPNPYVSLVDLTAWRREAIDRTLPMFPAEVPSPPLVEHGALVIVGGGGMPKGLMKKFVELAGGEMAKLVYVPCEEREEISPRQRITDTWKKMGVESATFIHTKDRNQSNSDDEFLAPLKDATGLWFGGGRQWNLSDSYYGTKAHKLMKDVLARGGVVGGSSAGASIQARYMARANPLANFDIMAPGYERGLGFVSGVAIDQHFTQRGRQKDMTQLVNRYPQLLGIGIDEATAIVVQKSVAEVTGRGKVHFYDRNLPVIPGEPDFIALDAGKKFDLAKRLVLEPEKTPEKTKDSEDADGK